MKNNIFVLIFSILVIMSAVLTFAGCSADSPESVSSDTADLERLYTEYLRLPFNSGIVSTTWNNPTEIEPDKFVIYYAYDQFYKDVDMEGKLGYPAEELEQFVQQHFDVTIEHLRSSGMYDKNEHIYINDGIGGASSSKIVNVTHNNNELILDFEVYDPADDVTVIWGGTLTVKLLEEGYQYIECQQWDSEMK